MDNTLICYCAGGLGNRLRPLSSCYSLAKKYQKKLIIIWPSTFRCRATFEDLYVSSDFDIRPTSILEQIKENCSVYGLYESVFNEHSLYNNSFLLDIVHEHGIIDINHSAKIQEDTKKNIIIIGNNFLGGVSREEENMFLREIITPTKEIQEKIKEEQDYLNLDKSVLGIQARATDFFVGEDYYFGLIENNVKKGSKLFVCSDSREMEIAIKNRFSNSYEILTRKDKIFVEKINQNNSWADNTETSVDCVKDGVVDMYLLSKTNFKLFNPNSTFAHIVNRMI